MTRPRQRTLCMLLFSEMAIICHSNKRGVDFMIPVLLPDDKLCEEVMTAIFIQVKQRVVAGPHEASVNFFPKGKAASKPESSHASKTREETPSRVDIPQKNSRTGLRPRPASTKVQHPRYTTLSYGCSSTVYKVIEPEQKARYAQLLASRDFLTSHARQTPESLLAVRRLKPCWEAGPACYHWLKNALLDTE